MNTKIAKLEAELEVGARNNNEHYYALLDLSLIHISEPTRPY